MTRMFALALTAVALLAAPASGQWADPGGTWAGAPAPHLTAPASTPTEARPDVPDVPVPSPRPSDPEPPSGLGRPGARPGTA